MITVGLTSFLHRLSHPDRQLTVVVSPGLNDAGRLKGAAHMHKPVTHKNESIAGAASDRSVSTARLGNKQAGKKQLCWDNNTGNIADKNKYAP